VSHAVTLMKGTWRGDSWLVHGGEVALLLAFLVGALLLSSRVFRWE
jgi:hypothetical protein